ncbi:hypothetical protein [Streptomyces xanthochromogenes]|uniref:hypothetical protein n=1 Tax=Streptomyces xanthochromogenes TaxID=67384 RepID=UPI0034212AE6
MTASDSVTVQKQKLVRDWSIIIDDFSAQMFSFLQVSETLIPEMAQRQENQLIEFMDMHRHLLSKDELTELQQAAEWFGGSLMRVVDHISKKGEEDVTSEGGARERDVPEGSFSFRSANASMAFGQVISDGLMGVKADPREDMLRKSLLVSSVSTFEVLFGRIAERVYRVNKSALNDSEYKFSLQDLAEFGTVEDAREFLVERRIAALMRDSVDGWEKWLGRALKGTSMEALPIDWPSTREVFARRNLVVHNGGVVNRIYLSIVDDLGRGRYRMPLGAKLKIDREYFAQGVQGLLALGVLLSVNVAEKLHKQEAGELSNLLFRLSDLAVRRKAWSVAEALSTYLLNGKLNRSSHLRAKLLNWTARKGERGPEEIRSEVEEWDVSGLSEDFAHCKAVLIGDRGEAVRAIEDLLAREKLTLVEVATNPIYAEIVSYVPSLSEARNSGPEGMPGFEQSSE